MRSQRATLERAGLRPKRSFGQNFLADPRIAERIAELATTPPGGTVIELGAGLGALTAPLLQRAARVFAVERDRDLVPLLQEDLHDHVASGRLIIAEADAKTWDVTQALDGPVPRVLAGNLPYQLTGPLLERSVELAAHLDRAVFMVQLEVADRLAAAPGGADYGMLTVFVAAAYSVTRAFVVRAGSFYPRPGVDSAVVLLERRAEPLARETPVFRQLVKAGFAQRRKQLRNAWASIAPVEALNAAAARAGIALDARAETLDVRAFARMERELGA